MDEIIVHLQSFNDYVEFMRILYDRGHKFVGSDLTVEGIHKIYNIYLDRTCIFLNPDNIKRRLTYSGLEYARPSGRPILSFVQYQNKYVNWNINTNLNTKIVKAVSALKSHNKGDNDAKKNQMQRVYAQNNPVGK